MFLQTSTPKLDPSFIGFETIGNFIFFLLIIFFISFFLNSDFFTEKNFGVLILFFINKYPESEYAIDLKLKKNLVINQFAARELHTAKYYISVQKWVPAINRLKLIVRNYDETIFIEEALHRLVEIHYHIGLEEEAKKFANILGYNYNSSEWYKQSYKIFNKKYQIKKPSRENEKNNNLLDKIIKIIK